MPLATIQNLQLKMHLAMCAGCRNYVKQSHLLNQLLENRQMALPSLADITLLKKTIIKKTSG